MIYFSLFSALLTTGYVILVSLIFQNAEKIFGKMQGLIGPIAFLMLFVLSATITGALILGKPLLLYLDGKKKRAILLFGQTVLFLAIITIIILAINLII